MYASLAQYVHANPSHQDPGLAIIDSGNNKHHSLKDSRFFPDGVVWKSVVVTGVHGTKPIQVGLEQRTSLLSVPMARSQIGSLRIQFSILPRQPTFSA